MLQPLRLGRRKEQVQAGVASQSRVFACWHARTRGRYAKLGRLHVNTPRSTTHSKEQPQADYARSATRSVRCGALAAHNTACANMASAQQARWPSRSALRRRQHGVCQRHSARVSFFPPIKPPLSPWTSGSLSRGS
jgi:hypothetical protein